MHRATMPGTKQKEAPASRPICHANFGAYWLKNKNQLKESAGHKERTDALGKGLVEDSLRGPIDRKVLEIN